MSRFDTTRTVIPQASVPYASQFLNLRGGVNNSISDESIRDDELSDARNFMPDTLNAGVITNRLGIQRYLLNQQTASGTSIYEGRNANYFTGTNTIKTFTSDTNLDATLSHTSAPDWTTLAGKDIFVNGTDAPRKITTGPVVAVLGGSPPTFRFIESYGRRVYGAGHSAGSLRWTPVENAESWPVINELFVTVDENDDITGLIKFNDTLMVFCEKSFHSIRHGNLDTDIAIRYSSFAEGCTSHRSLVSCPYGLFWWSKSGLCWTTNGQSFDLPLLRKVPNTLEMLNKTMYSKVHGAYHPRLGCVQYFVCTGSSTTENFSIWYYPPDERFGRQESVWLQDGAATAMGGSGTVTIDYSGDIYTVAAAQNSYLFKQASNADDGIPIAVRMDTKRESTQYGRKALKKCDTLMPTFKVDFQAAIDFSAIIDDAGSPDRIWQLAIISSVVYFGPTTIIGPTLIFQSGVTNEDVPIGYERNFHKIKYRVAADISGTFKVQSIINSGTLVHA